MRIIGRNVCTASKSEPFDQSRASTQTSLTSLLVDVPDLSSSGNARIYLCKLQASICSHSALDIDSLAHQPTLALDIQPANMGFVRRLRESRNARGAAMASGEEVIGLKAFVVLENIIAALLGAIIAVIGTVRASSAMAALLGVVLGTVGTAVLGLPYWLLSWILPVVGIIGGEFEDSWEMATVLGMHGLVLILGVSVLGSAWVWSWNLAIAVLVIVEIWKEWKVAVVMVVVVGCYGMTLLGSEWLSLWFLAIVVLVMGSCVLLYLPALEA